MSETVHYKGTLKEVVRLNNETLNDQCKRILNNEKLESYFESYDEKLLNDCYEEYTIHDNILYSVEKQDIENDGEIFNISKNGNGTFDFEVRYYNGGCCFDEAISYAFKYKK